MIGVALGLLYANAAEWWIHKHVLHGLGRDRESFWAFHWYEHHRETRLHGFRDRHYERSLFEGWHAQNKEVAALALGAAAHLALVPVAPYFTATVLASALHYHRVHKKSHLDPSWARAHVPWHYDHHMGPNQHANWCVTHPWFDALMGTRVPYVGTEREARDRARRAARERARAPSAAANANADPPLRPATP